MAGPIVEPDKEHRRDDEKRDRLTSLTADGLVSEAIDQMLSIRRLRGQHLPPLSTAAQPQQQSNLASPTRDISGILSSPRDIASPASSPRDSTESDSTKRDVITQTPPTHPSAKNISTSTPVPRNKTVSQSFSLLQLPVLRRDCFFLRKVMFCFVFIRLKMILIAFMTNSFHSIQTVIMNGQLVHQNHKLEVCISALLSVDYVSKI